MLLQRIDDKPLLKLIRRWLKAGILDTTGQVLHPLSGDTARRHSHAIDTNDNFEFERQIEFSRSNLLIDMRRKR